MTTDWHTIASGTTRTCVRCGVGLSLGYWLSASLHHDKGPYCAPCAALLRRCGAEADAVLIAAGFSPEEAAAVARRTSMEAQARWALGLVALALQSGRFAGYDRGIVRRINEVLEKAHFPGHLCERDGLLQVEAFDDDAR